MVSPLMRRHSIELMPTQLMMPLETRAACVNPPLPLPVAETIQPPLIGPPAPNTMSGMASLFTNPSARSDVKALEGEDIDDVGPAANVPVPLLSHVSIPPTR